MIVKLKGGKLKYKVIGREGEGTNLVLILEDPHTGKTFPVPKAITTLKTMGYRAK